MTTTHTSFWPHHLVPSTATTTLSPDPETSRRLIADIVQREHHDLPMPGVPASTSTLPFTTRILSSDPAAMRAHLRAVSVPDDSVSVVPMPHTAHARYWEDVDVAGVDVIVLDDVSYTAAQARRDVLTYVRVLAGPRQAIWAFHPAARRGNTTTLAPDAIESRVAVHEGRMMLGLAPRKGIRNPVPLVADMSPSGLTWLDPFNLRGELY